MDTSLSKQPLVSPVCLLTFTALSQIVLYLWATDRIDITMASSILLGFMLFGLLAATVREVLAMEAGERRAFGAARASR